MNTGDEKKTGSSRRSVSAAHADRSSADFAAASAAEPEAVADLEKYLVHLVHLDVALPLKIEMIRAWRGMMQSFVDRAFGDDPVQLAMRDGLVANKISATTEFNMIESQKSQTKAKQFRINPGLMPE